jgi:hypothetical protein
MAHEKLRAAAVEAVAEYMGIAAEFVVDDALQEVMASAAFAGKQDMQQMFFFVCLGKRLPPEVPYATVKQRIIKSTEIKA